MGLTIEQRSHKSHLGRFGGCLASGEEASNLIPTRNAGKGDCLYYSLASPIPGATHVTLRESIMDYILTHGDDEMSEGYTYRTAIESTGYTLEDYCVWQRKTGEFASPIEIAAFCRQYKKFVPVYTQSPDGSKYLLWWTMGDPSHPVVPLYYKGEHYEAMVENNDDEGWTRARKFGKASKLEVNDGESAGKAMPSRFESLLWDDETDDEEENECAAEVEVGSTPQQVSSVSLACSFRGGMVVDEDSESEINEKESTPAMPSSCTSDHKATEAPPTLTHGDLGTVHFDVLTSIPDAQLSAPICRLTSHASRRARQIARDEKKAQQQSQRTLATPQRPPQAKAGATSSTSRFSTGTPPASALDATSAATGSIPPPSPLVAPGSTPFLPDIRNTALSCPLTTVSLLSTTPCIPHTSLSPRRLDTAPGAAEEDAEWTAMKSPESALMSQTEEDYPGGMDSPTAADESFCAADGILTRRMLSLLEVQSSDLFTGEFQSSDGGKCTSFISAIMIR
uniref:OTU domain-containing protein n=1 Tax=Octactis speculum TaxID=3111310 RepID=A0A7S2BWB7_9STRA|mmetsp:Transcript_27588/g.37822  ORF Transcript_27588/g.37822 Transcript_27588/m.37822 type:complete len:509 (+) Transcript_27588:426-1952(+)